MRASLEVIRTRQVASIRDALLPTEDRISATYVWAILIDL